MPETKTRKPRADKGVPRPTSPGAGGRPRTHESGERLQKVTYRLLPGSIAWLQQRGGGRKIDSLVHGAMQDESNQTGGWDAKEFDPPAEIETEKEN